MAASDSFNTPTKNCENLQASFAALQQQAFAQASYKSCSLLVYIAMELLAGLQHVLTGGGHAQTLHRKYSGLNHGPWSCEAATLPTMPPPQHPSAHTQSAYMQAVS